MSSPNPKAYNIPAQESEKVFTNHINGTQAEINARFCIQELCKGRPVHHDFSEWHNYRSIFTKKGAHVWTIMWNSCSGGLPIDKFIEVSIQGRDNGVLIAHRDNGTLTDVDLSKGCGLGKMKATITQRFTIEGTPVDVDCDCRFIFSCKLEDTEWKAQYLKLFYEKDKVVPINGQLRPPHLFNKEDLAKYTEGYQHLAVAQHYIGHPILNDLPIANDKGFHDMYQAMADWTQARDIDLFWEHTD